MIFENKTKQAWPNQILEGSYGLPSSNSKKGKHDAQGAKYSNLGLNKHSRIKRS